MLYLEKLVGLLLKNQRKSDARKKGPWKSQRYTVTGNRVAYGRLNPDGIWARKRSRRLPMVPQGIYSSIPVNSRENARLDTFLNGALSVPYGSPYDGETLVSLPQALLLCRSIQFCLGLYFEPLPLHPGYINPPFHPTASST
ncbi:hypothetical protein P7K49_011383 [Saguinus oedipus]|uniref:Uncharacterized protein n=1 Tax=Saguinus oedipus TaxID=9490 RepID=A0ABQ9VU05_SAGOE|nr:hypothetical protein P7K49_011383 [Saguinus oedipus]